MTDDYLSEMEVDALAKKLIDPEPEPINPELMQRWLDGVDEAARERSAQRTGWAVPLGTAAVPVVAVSLVYISVLTPIAFVVLALLGLAYGARLHAAMRMHAIA